MPDLIKHDDWRWMHLQHFAIPVPPWFFSAIYLKRVMNKKTVYDPITWDFREGDTIHLHRDSWTANFDALPPREPALIQVSYTRKGQRDLAPLHFAIYANKPDHSGYEVVWRIETVQGAFVEFLKTGSWAVFDEPIRKSYWPETGGNSAIIELTIAVETDTD